MRRRTGLAALIAAAVLALVAAPAITRRAASAALERAARELGAELTIEALSGSPFGVDASGLRVERADVTARCDRARATLDWGGLLLGRVRLEGVRLGRCEIDTPAQGARGGGAARGATAPEDPVSAVVALAGRAGGRVQEIEAESVVASREGRTLELGRLRAAHDDGTWRGAVELRAGGDVTAEGSVRFTIDDAVTVAMDEPLRVVGLRWRRVPLPPVAVTCGACTLRPAQTGSAREVVAAFEGGPILAISRAELTSGGERPSLTVPEVSVALGPRLEGLLQTGASLLSLAERMADRPAPAEEADTAAPPPDAALVDHLRALAELPGWISDAHSRAADVWASRPLDARIQRVELEGAALCRETTAGLEVDGAGIALWVACGSVRVSARHTTDGRTRVAVEGLDIGDLPFAALAGLAGTLELDATASAAGQDVGTVTGSLRWSEGTFMLPGVAPTPVTGIDLALRLTATVSRESGDATGLPRIEVSLEGALEDVPLDARADVEGGRLIADVGVSAPTPCEVMWRAIPAELVPGLRTAGVTFTGSARPRVEIAYEVGALETLAFETAGFMGDCAIASIGAPYDPVVVNRSGYVHTVTEGATTRLRVGPGTRGYVPLDALPSYVPALMYLSEEIAFFDNPGFSETLMNRALRMNLRGGRYVYGGSTITQQLVKNLFFDRRKTLSRKLEEAIVVWRMEQTVSKSRILELYVNCIEFGPDIYGISAAAQYYFGRGPETLTPLEAAYLATLKPAPLEGERYLRRCASPDAKYWIERLSTLLQRLVDYGPFIAAEELAHYAPYVVALPASPASSSCPVAAIPRPASAVWESLPAARLRIFGRVEPAPR